MDFSALLNERQYEAVKHTDGPLLIIAGAGSGKTRVLTYRIAYLMEVKNVAPWNIMAITFTNKAASEMRERVDNLAGLGAQSVWISTFHSSCARILRRHIERIGYSSSFSIYDSEDSRRLIKDISEDMNINPKEYPPKYFQSRISYAKNHMIGAKKMCDDADNPREKMVAEVYLAYEKGLLKNNALDFDDLLIKCVELFENNPDVLESYQERLRYIMVDEYQDTNRIQFRLVELLSSKYRNLCVVGDDDQSIYKFRGADIRNILDFERVFPEARVIKLEQNYRSAGNILKGANGVIKNNKEHRDKTLWTANEDGDLIGAVEYESGFEEARQVVAEIDKRSASESLNSFAILYRTNAQSRLFEEQFVRRGIPYKIIGGINFYARKEIKDILAYLKIIDNAQDELSARRIINVPKRGIGDKSLEKISAYAAQNGITFFEALTQASDIPGLGRSGIKIEAFSTLIRKYRSYAKELPVDKLINTLVDETGYIRDLETQRTDEAQDRIENIEELISKAASYAESAEDSSLSGFLREVSLVADIDTLDENAENVVLMTLHSAKGLEYDNVYIVGMEEGLFPSRNTIFDADSSQLEEERRLFYVGMTRAKKTLKLTGANRRMVRGETLCFEMSRFVHEIPKELVRFEDFSYELNSYNKTAPSYNAASGIVFGSYANKERVKKESKAKAEPYGGVFDASQYKVQKAKSLDYTKGDLVRHKKYGKGIVLDIKDGARDFEVSVDFEAFGVKKMFAAFAKLEKIVI